MYGLRQQNDFMEQPFAQRNGLNSQNYKTLENQNYEPSQGSQMNYINKK